MIIRLEHLAGVPGFSATPGFCRRGTRTWLARHDIDWAQFRYQGVDESVLLAVGDAFALAVVKHAHDMEARRGRK